MPTTSLNLPYGLVSLGPVFGASWGQGQSWFVNPNKGSDQNDGMSVDYPFKSVGAALKAAVAGRNDIIYLFAGSASASATTDYQTKTLVWNKDLTHLVGVCAPTRVSQRARLACKSTATGVSPVLQVLANGCIFANFEVFGGISGDATSLGCIEVQGQRNYFFNVAISGMGTTDSVTAGGYSLKLTGAAECVFDSCTLGLDTIARDNTTKGELWLVNGGQNAGPTTRIEFRNCLFQGFINNAGYVHVTFDAANCIDRWINFIGCIFLSESANDASAQTDIFSSPAGLTQGYVNLKDCAAFTPGGTTAVWSATGSNKLKVSCGPLPVKTGGEAVIIN